MTNHPSSVPTPIPYKPTPVRSVRRHAKDVLSRPGVRMSMLLSFLVMLIVWIASVYLVENTWLALNWYALYEISPFLYVLLDGFLYLIDAVVVVFLGFPLLYGWLRHSYLAATGTTPPLSVLFAAFGNRSVYWRSQAIVLRMLLHIAIPVGGFALLVFLAHVVTGLGSVTGYILMVVLAILAAVVLIFGWIANVGLTMVVFLDINHAELGINALFSRYRALCRGRRSELWLLQLSLIPSWLLGVLSLGTLLLIHAVPHSLICMHRVFCRMTGEKLPTAAPVQLPRP